MAPGSVLAHPVIRIRAAIEVPVLRDRSAILIPLYLLKIQDIFLSLFYKFVDLVEIFRRKFDKAQADPHALVLVNDTGLNLNGMFIRIAKLELKIKKNPYREADHRVEVHAADAQIRTAAHSHPNDLHLFDEGDSLIDATFGSRWCMLGHRALAYSSRGSFTES
jgi:hypothetical protein